LSDVKENTDIAATFVTAWNGRDMAAFERLFHQDFTWHIAVTDHDDPQMRPLHSKLLSGKNLSWPKSIFDKAETLRIFGAIFERTPRFTITARSFTAQDDRVVVELIGDALNEANGRRYNNLYCYVFAIRDRQIILFREYQDTLLLFDVWVAD
jgi:ketosteroid isomerase-like protein